MPHQELIAQILGIAGMTMNILSFLQKSQRRIIVMQLFGGAFFALNYLLLGSATGCLLNVAAVFRAVVYSNKEKFHAEKKGWFYGFSAFFVLSYILTFAAFGKAPTPANFAIELLPVVAMIIATYAFSLKNAAQVRKLGLVYCPMWLVYNCFVFSIGGILCEAFSIGSIIVGYLRHDRVKGK